MNRIEQYHTPIEQDLHQNLDLHNMIREKFRYT